MNSAATNGHVSAEIGNAADNKLHAFFMQAPAAIAILEGELHIYTFANPLYQQLYNRTEGELLGRTVRKVFPELSGQGIYELLDSVFTSGQAFNAKEFPATFGDGSEDKTGYYNVTIQPIKDDSGTVTDLMAQIVEVTEQVLAKQRLAEREAAWEELANAMPQLVWIADVAGEVTYYNERVHTYAGAHQDETGRWRWAGMLHHEDIRATAAAWEHAVQTGTVYSMEHRIQMADGSYRWHLSRAHRQAAEDGKTAKWFGTATDIHERKNAEANAAKAHEATERQQRLYQTVTDNTPDLIYVFDLSYRFTYANKALLAMWGKTWDEAIGKGLLENGYEPWHAEMHHREIDQVVATRQPIRGTVSFPHAELGKRIYDYIFSPVLNERGEIEAVAGTTRDISEIINVEEALRQAKEQLELTFNNVPSGISLFDASGKILLANDQSARLVGYGNAAEMMAQQDMARYAPKAYSEFDYYDEGGHPVPPEGMPANSVLLGGSGKRMAIRIVHKADDDTKWVMATSSPLYGEEGRLSMVLATYTDITEQKMAESAIRQSEQQFRTLAETLPQMIWMNSADGTPEYKSPQWLEYFGQDSHEAWSTMTHADDKTASETAFTEAMVAEAAFYAEVRLKNKDGIYRWHSSVARPVKDAVGKVIIWIGSLTDIHDQKTLSEKLEAQVALRTAEVEDARQLLQTVLDSSVEQVVAFDTELRFTLLNKQTLKFMGKPANELIGRKLTEVYPAILMREEYQLMQQALRGEPAHVQQRTAYLHGEVRLESYYLPIRAAGSITGMAMLSRDITPFLKLTEELQQANAELQRSNDDLQQFAHVASHDLKEPLRKIKTFAGMLEKKLDGVALPESVTYMGKINSAASRMADMVEGVLAYSSLNAGQQSLEPIDLGETIRAIETDTEVAIGQKGATITCANLPTIEGAPVLIYQLFYNLINNSLKFAKPDKAMHITITGSVAERNGQPLAQIRVEDNGIGFEQAHAERIFDTFSRLNPKDKYEGTGLGLALCKKIAERHGGTIKAQSTPGAGATFIITLPLVQGKENL